MGDELGVSAFGERSECRKPRIGAAGLEQRSRTPFARDRHPEAAGCCPRRRPRGPLRLCPPLSDDELAVRRCPLEQEMLSAARPRAAEAQRPG